MSGEGAAAQLHAHLRAAGVALALSLLVPLDTGHDGVRFLWQLAPDLGPVSLGVLLAPACCGAVVVACTFACRRSAALAVVALAAVAGLFGVTLAGSAALARDLLPEPEIWRAQLASGLTAVALTAAGVSLYPVASARRAARSLLVAALPCAAAHLLLPAGGEAPLLLVVRVIRHVASFSGSGNLLSACLFALVVVWPGVAVVAGWFHARRPAPGPRPLAVMLAAYALPVVLLPFALRSMADPWSASSGAAVALGGMAVLAAVLVVLASASSLLASLPPPALRRERATALGSLAAVTLTALVASQLAGRTGPAAALRFGPTTPEGDRLFGVLLPRWSDARARVDRGSGAADPELATAEAMLASSAGALDPGLATALTALVSEVGRTGLLERRWYRLVERVNEASGRAGLPYYVDPTGLGGTTGDPDRRWARVDTYRIEAVHRFLAAGREVRTLHVRAMDPARARAASMGLSRDQQPFAVVVLDEIDAYARELEQLVAPASPASPRCGEGPVDSDAAEDALRDCGQMLADLVRRGELRPALLELTERHEAQHQIDGAYLGRSGWLQGRLVWHPPELRARIQRELSAYLAQMTAGGPSPRITLLRLLRLSLLVRRGAEHPTALLAFEALGDGEPVLARGDSVARAYTALRAEGDEALRLRAARAWRRVFGRELASLRAEGTATAP
jgi:hypothetical protein